MAPPGAASDLLEGYGDHADCPTLAQRAGHFVGKVLQGAKPADLPVEQPMKYHLASNLKTAKALGITISPTFLFLVDEVIK
jgi:putative tryptophan/tyrosine transport system substrate-binding protein